MKIENVLENAYIEVNLGKIKQNAPTLCVRYEGKIIPLNTQDMRPILMNEENAIG